MKSHKHEEGDYAYITNNPLYREMSGFILGSCEKHEQLWSKVRSWFCSVTQLQLGSMQEQGSICIHCTARSKRMVLRQHRFLKEMEKQRKLSSLLRPQLSTPYSSEEKQHRTVWSYLFINWEIGREAFTKYICGGNIHVINNLSHTHAIYMPRQLPHTYDHITCPLIFLSPGLCSDIPNSCHLIQTKNTKPQLRNFSFSCL